MKYPLFILALFFSFIAGAQQYNMQAPVGFGRNATGGAGGVIKTVSTIAQLKSALTASGAATVIITQDLTFRASDMISAVVTNKTLLGLKGVKLIQNEDGGILGLKAGSNNVIIRNLIFEGPSPYDIDGNDLLENKGCTNFWVDHCEFYDGLDGNFDNTKTTDNVTISWCKFGYNKPPRAGGSGGSNDHRFSNLVGGSKSDYPADGHYSITFMYCNWAAGCRERMPRARNAELHIFNCLYNSPVTNKCIGLGGGTNNTTCYVEGCVFSCSGSIFGDYTSSDGGTVAINFTDILTTKSYSNKGTVSAPEYTYTAIPATAVEAAVLSSCGAGATLDITESGVISIPCKELSLPPVGSGKLSIYTSGKQITVAGVDVAEMNLLNLSGKSLKNQTASQTMNVNHLLQGIYLMRIRTIDGSVFNHKILVD